MSVELVDAETLLKASQFLFTGKFELPGEQEIQATVWSMSLSIREHWRSEVWPDVLHIEERYFRENWSAATTYDKTDEVYDPATQKYFQSLRDTNLNNAPTIASVENSQYWAESRSNYSASNWVTATSYAVGDKVLYLPTNRHYQCHTAHTSSGTLVPDATGADERWGILTRFERYVDKDATGQTVIGDVLQVKSDNSLLTTNLDGHEWSEIRGKIYVRDNVKRCTITFRSRPPRLKGREYVSTNTYAVGDQVYWDNNGTIVGNFYNAIDDVDADEDPTANPEKWSVVEIPLPLEGYIVCGAVSKLLVGDGQHDRAAVLARMAELYPSIDADVLFRQQGLAPAVSPTTY